MTWSRDPVTPLVATVNIPIVNVQKSKSPSPVGVVQKSWNDR